MGCGRLTCGNKGYTGVLWGFIGIMEKKIETIVIIGMK